MVDTFSALLFAHVLADFVLQTSAMAGAKTKPGPLALHGMIVLVTAALATGSVSPWLLVLAFSHVAIDLVKGLARKKGIGPFLVDQAAHLAVLAALAWALPDMMAKGLWNGFPLASPIMALMAGALLATRAGGFAVGLLMEPWASAAPAGLPGAGRAIGNIERGLIFLLILTGQAQSIGFLIAAKSVLRFGSISNEKEVSEYVIIGTLASFTWAIAASVATLLLLTQLPALGIPDLLP
jgi:hypothetical protein